jgi:hypothetical protein
MQFPDHEFKFLPIPENQRREMGFTALIVRPKVSRLLDFGPRQDDIRWMFPDPGLGASFSVLSSS